MRVIAVSTLRAFWERLPDAEQPLKAWYERGLRRLRRAISGAFGPLVVNRLSAVSLWEQTKRRAQR
jgi:hypothetical protein